MDFKIWRLGSCISLVAAPSIKSLDGIICNFNATRIANTKLIAHIYNNY